MSKTLTNFGNIQTNEINEEFPNVKEIDLRKRKFKIEDEPEAEINDIKKSGCNYTKGVEYPTISEDDESGINIDVKPLLGGVINSAP